MDFIEDLFEETPERDEFHFTSIDVAPHSNNTDTEVTYTFTYSNRWPMHTKVVFPGLLFPELKYQAAIFSVGMCVLPWYWMGHGCKSIIINEGVLVNMPSPDVIMFWQYLYSNVLLEYLVCNPGKAEAPVISLSRERSPNDHLREHAVNHHTEQELVSSTCSRGGVLIPLGGGKDSLVAWHLSQETDREADIIHVCEGRAEFEKNTRMHAIAKQIGKKLHIVEHKFDYVDIIRRSKYNLVPEGHPWAALVLFDAVVVALLCGHSEVHMGFEKSADFGNGVHVNGVEVNHQFDKSSQFLQAASEYIACFINPDLRVISPLDSMWDLEVAEIFCTAPRLKPFHELFISCNEVVNSTEWCCKCDKCAFVYIIMSAFLPPRKVQTVFHGHDLLSDWDMCDRFLSLVGGIGDGEKPFECVGTALETQAAVELAIGQLLKHPEQYENSLQNEEQENRGRSVPAGLLLVCEYLGLSKYDLPEYADLPLDEQLHKLLKKYIK